SPAGKSCSSWRRRDQDRRPPGRGRGDDHAARLLSPGLLQLALRHAHQAPHRHDPEERRPRARTAAGGDRCRTANDRTRGTAREARRVGMGWILVAVFGTVLAAAGLVNGIGLRRKGLGDQGTMWIAGAGLAWVLLVLGWGT